MRSLWTWQIFVPWFRLVWTPSRSTGALLDLVWLVSINGAIRRRVEKGSVETNFGRVCFLPEHDAEEEIWTRRPGLALCCQRKGRDGVLPLLFVRCSHFHSLPMYDLACWSRRGNGLKSSPDGPQPPPALGDLPDDLTIPVATSARVRIKKQYLAKYSTNIVSLRGRCNRAHWNSGPRLLHPQILNAGPSECSRPSCLAASAA